MTQRAPKKEKSHEPLKMQGSHWTLSQPNSEQQHFRRTPAPSPRTRGAVTLMDRQPDSLFTDRSADREVPKSVLPEVEMLPQSESLLARLRDPGAGSSRLPLVSSPPKVSRALLLGRLWLAFWDLLAAGLRSPLWSAAGCSSDT